MPNASRDAKTAQASSDFSQPSVQDVSPSKPEVDRSGEQGPDARERAQFAEQANKSPDDFE